MRKIFLGLLLVVGAVTQVNADIVARFDDDSGLLNAVNPLPAVEVISGVSAGDVTQSGLAAFTNVATWPVGTWDATLNLSKFVGVTITPDVGTTMDFTDAIWDKGFFNGTAGEVRTSLDGFASGLPGTGSFANTGGDITFDLSSLTGVTSPVEFRFFFTGAGAFTDLATVNGNGLTFNGTVTAVPEPFSCLALLSVTGLLGLVRRRD